VNGGDTQEAPIPAHSLESTEVSRTLGVDRETGLSSGEVERRRRQHGLNQLREAQSRSAWLILLEQFRSVVILVLVGALVLAIVFAKWPEAIAIAAVIAINTAIGFFSGIKAVRSMEALRRLGKLDAQVRRDGGEQAVSAVDLVPGDILVLKAEALVPADARLLEGQGCRVNEAALTGESVPVNKRSEPVAEAAPLAERTSMLYKGTTVVEGRVEAVVVATGMQTELGRISEMAEQAEATATPLQKRLDRLGRRLAVIVIAIAIILAGAGLLAGRDTLLMIETAIALGVAAIPEGLPIVATIALARGMWIMARRHALINRLTAVETLGATRVIFTDKTGTLTENRMTLRRVVSPAGDHELHFDDDGRESPTLDDPVAHRLIDVAVLCNNAAFDGDDQDEAPRGDPTELALLEAGAAFGRRRHALLEEAPEIREVSFDSDTMMMATYHRAGDRVRVAVKGATDAVLHACDRVARGSEGGDGAQVQDESLDESDRRHWEERSEALAADGLRVLAVAEKDVDSDDAEPYGNLGLLGLVGLLDPPRQEVRDAINTCQRAGVKVVMVTGDQPATAKAIAEAVGIVGDPSDPEARVLHGRDLEHPENASPEQRESMLTSNIFARVSPEQKLNLVSVFQDAGEIVAMTGDGVNDAPALKKADIGIAMGRRGTDAAKQVADMVLTDDAFASIVAAVEQGRVIFGNIRKSVMFMLCTNVAEVLAVTVASLVLLPIPLRPLQILYLNVLTDVFPALAIAMTRGGPEVMDRPPRDPDESILTRAHWTRIAGWSAILAACVLIGLFIALRALGLDQLSAVTVSFLTLAYAKLWFVFNLRDRGIPLLRSPMVRNPWLWGAIAFCAALLVAAVYLPGLSDLLQTRDPGPAGWGIAIGLSLAPFAIGQALIAVRGRP